MFAYLAIPLVLLVQSAINYRVDEINAKMQSANTAIEAGATALKAGDMATACTRFRASKATLIDAVAILDDRLKAVKADQFTPIEVENDVVLQRGQAVEMLSQVSDIVAGRCG